MFLEKYKLTTSLDLPEPKFSRFARGKPWCDVRSGLYNNGVITLFDINFDDSFMNSWSWLIGNRALLIGALCWRDFFMHARMK